MNAYSPKAVSRGFIIDRDEARETARRQFTVSAIIVFALLFVAVAANWREAFRQTSTGASGVVSGRSVVPVKSVVYYFDRSRSFDHKLAVAENGN